MLKEANSDILREGAELPVLLKDGLQRGGGGLDLQVQGRALRRLER